MSKVKHIVLLKFKDGVSEEQVDKLFEEVLDMSEAVEGIEDYVSGVNCSAQEKNQGFSHGFIMTFTNAAARDAYLTSEPYVQHTVSAGPLVESSVVFDFEV